MLILYTEGTHGGWFYFRLRHWWTGCIPACNDSYSFFGVIPEWAQ